MKWEDMSMRSDHPYLKGRIPPLALIGTTVGCIITSIICLHFGYTIIFQNLFYIPIILACVLYTRKGLVISCLLALIYFGLMAGYTQDTGILLQAFIRVILFVCIAAVITTLTIAGKQSEEKYRLLAENSYDVIYLMDVSGSCTYVSPSCLQFSGFTPEEIVHKSLDKIVSRKSLPVVKRAMKKALDTSKSGMNHPIDLIEVEFLKKDGTTRWAEISPQAILNDTGKPIGYLGVSRDISTRREAEQALRDSENRFRQLVDSTEEGIIIHKNGIIIDFNDRICEIVGYTREEMKGKDIFSLVAPDYIPVFKERISTPHDHAFEIMGLKKGTIPFWGEFHGREFIFQNEVMQIVTIWDTTERHHSESRKNRISQLKGELFVSLPLEEKLKKVTDSLIDIFNADFSRIWLIKKGDFCNGGCSYASGEKDAMLCHDHSRCLHLMVSSGRYTHIDGEHSRMPFGVFKVGKIANGEEKEYFTNDVTHDPAISDHSWAASLGLVSFGGIRLESADGESIGVLGFFSKEPVDREMVELLKDIGYMTSLVIQTSQAEMILRDSEEQFRRIIENVPFSLAIITNEGKIRYINPMGVQFYGFESDVMAYDTGIPMFWADPDERNRWLSQIQSFGMVSDFEMHILAPNGRELWMSEFGIRIRYQDESCILLTQLDITERKLAEQAIRESEEKFISIFQETPDPTIIIGQDMQIIEVNQGFERIFGSDDHQIMGTKLDDTSFINLSSRIKSLDHTDMAKKSAVREEMTFFNQSGAPFIAEVTISSITIQGKPCQIVQIHDIDEIRRAHDAVAQVNHKLKILSSITRHDILNRVMVTLFYSEELKNAVTDLKQQKQAEAIFISSGEIRDLISFTGQYQDLGAEAPGWQQIDKILKLREITGLLKGVTLTSDLGPLQIYADLMLEKVIYNLVENSVRHGQNLARIRLTSYEEAGDLIIWYEDDGGGIVKKEKEKAFEKGFGKNTGLGLFLIREILSITGITIIETGEPGVGVRFEIRVPAGKFRKTEG